MQRAPEGTPHVEPSSEPCEEPLSRSAGGEPASSACASDRYTVRPLVRPMGGHPSSSTRLVDFYSSRTGCPASNFSSAGWLPEAVAPSNRMKHGGMLSARLGTEQAPYEPSLRDTQTLSKTISLTVPRSQSIRRSIDPEVDPPVTSSSGELLDRRWDGNRRWSLPGKSVASFPPVRRASRTNPWVVFLTARRLCL